MSWEVENYSQKKIYETELITETENISESVEKSEIRRIRCETAEEAEKLFSDLCEIRSENTKLKRNQEV